MSDQSDFRSEFLARTLSWSYLSAFQAANLADYALAQANHESGGFGSHLAVTCHNVIGYKQYPGSIWQSGLGFVGSPEGDRYANYSCFANCGGELADWIHRRKDNFQTVSSLEEYVTAMQAGGWFTDSFGNYLAGCTRWYYPDPSDDVASSVPPDAVSQAIGYVTTSPDILYAVIIFSGIFILRSMGLIKKR